MDTELSSEEIQKSEENMEQSAENANLSFEFAGNSSDEEKYDNFKFAGGESSGGDIADLDDKFFAGKSDNSFSSIDFFEPREDSADPNQYEFKESFEEKLEPYKHCVRNLQPASATDDQDLQDPVFSTKPKGHNCSRFCENNCNKVRSSDSVMAELASVRAKLLNMTRVERRNYLLDQLSRQSQFGLPADIFYVKGEHLCVKFFSEVVGVSTRVLVSVIEDFRDNVQRYYHGLESTSKMSLEMTKFITWLVSFSKLHGEHKPDDMGVIALSSVWTKVKLFDIYTLEVGGKFALSTFYQAWEVHFGRKRRDVSLPCVVIPKETDHCKCTECLAWKKFKRRAKTELQISVSEQLLQCHLSQCARERIHVWSLFKKCVDFKEENIGLQFDDMDQTKESHSYRCFPLFHVNV